MSEEIKEIPLKERIEKLLESGWVNEFNYLESQLQEARYLVVILQQKVEQLEKENKELNLELSGYRQAILNDDNLMGLKLKIDKAITYIKTGKTFENKNTKKVVDIIQNDLLNILNKGSEE